MALSRSQLDKLGDRLKSGDSTGDDLRLLDEYRRSFIEIQVRTELQHLWAVMSEKVVDRFGHAIKYGAGDETIGVSVLQLSDEAFRVELASDVVRLLMDRVVADGNAKFIAQLASEEADLDHARRILADRLQRFSENPDALLDPE